MVAGEAALLTLVFSRTSNLSEVLDTNLTPAGPTRPAAPFPEFSNQKVSPIWSSLNGDILGFLGAELLPHMKQA